MSAERPVLVVLVPIAPAPTGNGLAMRMWSLICAAGIHHDVLLFVLPFSGSTGIEAPTAPGVVARHDITLTMGSGPAPTFRPNDLRERIGDHRVDGVMACRLGVAQLGVNLAARYGVPLILDADDDDVALMLSRGELDAAAVTEKVGTNCFPRACVVTAASEAVAASISSRYQLGDRVAVAPNTVAVPDASTLTEPPGSGRVLFIGNLRYPPNIEGVAWLVNEVLPQLPPDLVIDVVGRATPEVDALAGDRVKVWGAVNEVAPYYAAADVIVAPLWSGSGTRIKILEAFAHRRPVVSTTVGADGLNVVDGVHLRIADDAQDFARAIVNLRHPSSAAPLVADAYALVSEEYDELVVRNRIASVIADAVRSAYPPAVAQPPYDIDSAVMPETAAGLEISEDTEGLVVFDPSTGQIYHLNPSASAVFSLCTGTNTVADIAAEVRTLFELADAPTAEVVACLNDLAGLQLLR